MKSTFTLDRILNHLITLDNLFVKTDSQEIGSSLDEYLIPKIPKILTLKILIEK